MKILIAFIMAAALLVESIPAAAGVVWLDALETNQALQPWGQPQRNLSSDRTPPSIGGKTYRTGVGVQSPNVSPGRMRLRLTADDLKLSGKYVVRDLWQQKDLGELGNGIQSQVNGHGVLLLRLRPIN